MKIPLLAALLSAATLTCVTATANDITWTGTSGGTWDTATANWTGDATIYADGDNVTFGGSSAMTVNVAAGGVAPGLMTVSATGAYTFQGGGISGAMVKSGSAALSFTNINNFSSITIAGGPYSQTAAALQFSNGNELGSGKVTVTNTANMSLFYNSGTAAGGLANLGNDVDLGSGSSSRIIRLISKDSSTLANATTMELSGAISGGDANTTIQIETNAGSTSNSVVKLSGNNTFEIKEIKINRGVLAIGSAASVGNVALGNTLNAINSAVGVGSSTVAGVRFDADMTLNNRFIWSSADNLNTNGHNVTLAGVFSGSGAITKRGAGALTLTGTNTLSGNIIITSGSVITGNVSALGTSKNITVNSGTVLQIGDGTVNGVTLDTSAVVSVAGTLAFGDESSSITNGAITLNNGILDFSAFYSVGDYDLLINSTMSGTYSVIGLEGASYTFDINTGALSVTAVPELSTYGIIAGGLLLIGAGIVRRRRSK